MDGRNSIADDILRNGFERWQRLEGEKQAISDDLKELFAELKSQGFDGKALRAAFRTVAKADDAAVQDLNATVDLYVDSLMAPRASATGTTIAIAQARSAGEPSDPIAALRTDPSMAIVSVDNLKKPETQSAPQAGSDLTNPAPKGQVAPNPVAKAADDANSGSAMSEVSAAADAPEQAEVVNRVAGDRAPAATSEDMDATAGETATNSAVDGSSEAPKAAGKSVEASASAAPAPKYAEPGVSTWETHPPEGVERGAISTAFGTMGQDTAVIADELERGAAQPIVKKGKVILDGWARYMAARNMVELDGSAMAYPVVQYAGDDLLVDIIRLNVEGRMLTEQQKRLIAANLARQEPSRKDDIYRAFELWMEPV
ncbi:MAG TPA: GapR family DNA-binding domain-containing protein [Devosia sp.]|jgi:uncharacterized protein (UPF0335 family)|nr:GapR family DNA-binding domain-containing protein [Devosia sp.]